MKTKSELAEYLATKMLVHSQSDQNRLNKFMVTAGTKTKGNIDVPDNLASHSQEEADTLLLLHATTISDDAELTISSPDTDVFSADYSDVSKATQRSLLLNWKE